MPFQRDSNGNIIAAVGGFQATSLDPSVPNAGSFDLQMVVRKTGAGGYDFSKMPRMVEVKNRAEKGYVKVWYGVLDGQMWPEGAISEDKATWLQPGDTVYIPTPVAIHFFGNFGQNDLKERERIIRTHGDWQYEGIPFEGSRRMVSMHKVGPPPKLPDLLLTFVDQRNRPVGETVSLFEWCVGKNPRYHVTKDKAIKERDAEELLIRIREFALEPA